MATMTITKMDVTAMPGPPGTLPLVKMMVNGKWRKVPFAVEAQRG